MPIRRRFEEQASESFSGADQEPAKQATVLVVGDEAFRTSERIVAAASDFLLLKGVKTRGVPVGAVLFGLIEQLPSEEQVAQAAALERARWMVLYTPQVALTDLVAAFPALSEECYQECADGDEVVSRGVVALKTLFKVMANGSDVWCRQKAEALERSGSFEEALTWANRAADIALRLGDLRGQVAALSVADRIRGEKRG